jgi:hypothetical protein
MVSLLLAALLAADPAPVGPATPAAAPPAAAPAPPATPAASPAGADTVHLVGGGRARGTVFEDSPETGVSLQLPDGSLRRFPRAEVVRVDYAGEKAAAPPAASPPAFAPPPPPQGLPPPPQAYPPAQAYPPQPAAPAEYERPRDPMLPATLTLAVGGSGAASSGSVSERYGSTSNNWSGFGQLDLEAGVRVTPAATVLAQLDIGVADVSGDIKRQCEANRFDCTVATVRIGVAGRYAFMPTGRHTPWVSVGIGREGTAIGVKSPWGNETIAFGGWEWLKLGAGWDLRFSRSFGLGAFVGYSFASYNSMSASGEANLMPGIDIPRNLGGSRTHTWFQLGLRAILFP